MRIILKRKIWFSPKASKQLKSLRPVFKELRKVYQHFVDCEGIQDNPDCPFWHIERPQVGFLAAAVWLYGGNAVEEYSAEKTKQRRNRSGRCDLFLRIDPTYYFECEAKRCRHLLRKAIEEPPENITKYMNLAVADVKKLKRKKGLALSFVTIEVSNPKVDVGRIDKLFKRLKRHRKAIHAMVLVRVDEMQQSFVDKAGRKYPGVLLTIKEVR